MLRSILAVILGLVIANLVVFAIEFASHAIYPPPAGLDFRDPTSLRAFMATMPIGAFTFVLVGGVVGTSSGAWSTARVARRKQILLGLIVGGLVTVAATVNAFMLPHPAWFRIVSPASILPAAYLGARIAFRPVRLTAADGHARTVS